MKLWTWQKKDFSLINSVKLIDSRNHSEYYNEHKEKFEKLWDRLKTNQFLWCYSEKENAFSEASKLEYKNHVLWELDIPVDSIFKNICSIAWSGILYGRGCSTPSKLRNLWIKECSDNFRKKEEDWHRYWENKTTEELWEALFLSNTTITPCSTPLVCYPLEQQWGKCVVVT